MERTVPRPALRAPKRLLALRSDEQLVRRTRAGDETAFEVLYERHVAGVLGFCRHMLGSQHEAEDAVQQAFAAAHRALLGDARAIVFKPWLYAIARNRCVSMLRARRERPAELAEISTAGLNEEVERRADLRELVADVQLLPEAQRAALVLAELGGLSHAEIATVLGQEPAAVKGLVFRARAALAERRAARAAECGEIRLELAAATGGGLRRGRLRYHLESCPGCRFYLEEVRRQRRLLGLALPVVPAVGLKEAVLGGVGGGGASAGGIAAAGGSAGGSAAAGGSVAAGGSAAVGGAVSAAAGAGAGAGGLAVGGGTGGAAGLLAGGVAAKVATVGALAVGGLGAGMATEAVVGGDRAGVADPPRSEPVVEPVRQAGVPAATLPVDDRPGARAGGRARGRAEARRERGRGRGRPGGSPVRAPGRDRSPGAPVPPVGSAPQRHGAPAAPAAARPDGTGPASNGVARRAVRPQAAPRAAGPSRGRAVGREERPAPPTPQAPAVLRGAAAPERDPAGPPEPPGQAKRPGE